MTLLELLRQELPKRGGWPEGVDYCVQHAHGLGFCWVIFGKRIISRTSANAEGMWEMNYNFSHDVDFCANELASDHATAIVTREQYEATGWDGTGLPPVGCNIEVNSPRFGWHLATVTAVTGSWVIAKYSDGTEYAGCHRYLNTDGSWTDNSGIFRPIRTEAERAIDEMVRLSGVSIGAAKILYDAGYRKG